MWDTMKSTAIRQEFAEPCDHRINVVPGMKGGDGRRAVAVLLHKPREREAVRRDERLFEIADDGALQARAPVIAPDEQRIARGRAHAAAGVRIGEAHTLRREPVVVRRGNLAAFRIVAPHIAITYGVSYSYAYVRILRRIDGLNGTE